MAILKKYPNKNLPLKHSLKTGAGFIALMAVIVISLVLLVMTVEESSSGWHTRFNILGTEAKEQASSLAEGCAEQALATMLTDPAYMGNATTTITEGTCYVFPVQLNFPVAGLVTIKTQAVVRGSYANLDMAMNMNNIHFGSIPTTPTTGTLFITTHVVNDSSGTKQAGDFTMNVSANPSSSFAGSESGVAVTVQPGAYSVGETALPNYSVSPTSDCSGNIVAGQIKFCTITDDDITTTLTIIANVVNNNGGTNAPADFPLFIDGASVTLGQRIVVTAGAHNATSTTLSGYAASPWGYDCSAGGSITMSLGQNKTCIINFDDLPPPSPVCADTVMVLDRTGSMSSSDLTGERTAATSLVNLYSTVTPLPQIGVGSFGGLTSGSPASIPTNPPNSVSGFLTTIYSAITNAIITITNSNSSVGSDLSAAITVASAELNSPRHIVNPPPPNVEKKKVMILVSDGVPNQPSGSAAYDTGFKSATSSIQNASGDFWNNPTGAYNDGGSEATSTISSGSREQYYNFGFGGGAGLPTGSTVSGIEAQADAWATAASTTANTPNLAPTALGPSTSWNPNTGSDVSAVTTNDTTSYIVPESQEESFAFTNAGIPAGSTVNSVIVHAVALGSGSTLQFMEENGTNQTFEPTIHSLGIAYTDYSYAFPTMPSGASWTLSEVNAWTTRFGVVNVSGATARVTRMYVVVNYTTTTSSNVQKAPTGTMGSPNNQWTSPSSAFLSDNVYATDATNGHLEGYSNFGFAIPAGATITGIQVTAEAKVSGGGTPTNTPTLYPQNNGNYTDWNGDVSGVDETGTPVCNNGDYINTSTNNNRSSFTLNLNSIPNGSIINNVTITVGDRGDSSAGGTYRTFVRLNGINTDASGAALVATGSSGSTCTIHAQTITPASVTKNSGTTLEVGVVKVSGNNNSVRVGTINAVVNYTPPSSGSITMALSSNNGVSWTNAENTNITTTETVVSPTGNGPSDLWSRSWTSVDFNNGNFVLRVTNNSTTGTTVSLDQVTVQVFYTTSTAGVSSNLAPTALGPSTSWNPNTGSDVSAVTTNDTTSYIVPESQEESFAFTNAGIPAGSTVNSVIVHAVALGSGSTLQFMEENGTNQTFEPTIHSLGIAYTDYSYAFPTMPSGASWTLSEVNAWTTRFGVVNVSGATARVTRMYVVVNYNAPAATACQLGVDLSWNGGTSWSSEKTQTLTDTETTYTLGSASDDWSSSHTWAVNEFSNTNFRARVHAINPGSSCSNIAVDHLDWLQLKVHYTAPTDPTAAAYAAADLAKLSGIDIFTIHFGDVTGRDLLARLASGSTPNPPYQNGSYNDPGGVLNGDTGLVSPTLQSATTGGSGNGFEVSPNNAFADGPSGISGAAQNINGTGDRHLYYGYNFVVPPNAIITGIQTRLDWWLDSTSGTNSMGVELSWDGGNTWTPMKTDANESTSVSNTRTLGSSSDTWGHAWTADNLASANFRVRITSNSTVSTRDFYLDWIPVQIYYTVIQENGDGDNFFISPTSSDMQNIFNFIGKQVCPALLSVAPTPPPTTGTIIVMTNVVNNNGGSKIASDFTANVSAVNPSQTSFAGNATGVSITVDPGAYSITENNMNGYTELPGAICSSAGSSGPIAAGETRVCVFTNDDLPPPPPPPNLNLDPSSWHEIPTAN